MSRRILLTTDVVGGVWDFCVTLTAGLRAAGDDVVLLALGSPSPAQRVAVNQAGASLVSQPLKLEWMKDANEDVAITGDLVGQVARQVGADLVHANQFAAACCDVDVPVVLTVHSDVLSWRRWTLGATGVPPEWQAYFNLVQEACSRADYAVAVSQFLADEVTQLYEVRRSIHVIHNGWTSFHPPAATPRDRTVVAGRIWDAAKNIDLVARAAEGWEPGPVLLAGETSHPDGGVATIPPPLTPVGFLERAELDALLERARVYVSAAKYDPFGLLPLQAALQGCMLLLSDIPAYRELWADAATYFRCDDEAALREKWRLLLVQTSDSRAFERARTLLTSERMVDKYRRLYNEARRAVAV